MSPNLRPHLHHSYFPDHTMAGTSSIITNTNSYPTMIPIVPAMVGYHHQQPPSTFSYYSNPIQQQQQHNLSLKKHKNQELPKHLPGYAHHVIYVSNNHATSYNNYYNNYNQSEEEDDDDEEEEEDTSDISSDPSLCKKVPKDETSTIESNKKSSDNGNSEKEYTNKRNSEKRYSGRNSRKRTGKSLWKINCRQIESWNFGKDPK